MNTGDLHQGSIKAEFLIHGQNSTRALHQHNTIQYIQDLFHVSVYAPGTHDPRGEWVTLNGTQENIAKAKKYILAKCIPEMRVNVPNSSGFASFLFTNGTKVRQELEKEYQVVITADSSGNVFVQGVEADLYKVSQRLYSLKDTYTSSCQAPEPVKPREPAVYSTTETRNSPRRSPVHQQPTFHDTTPGLLPRGQGLGLESQINYYVKLGYPREKIEYVLLSSPGATDDIILKRLIEATATKRVERDRDLVPQRPVTVNPDQLRPVVIDGSNVAMRHGNGHVFSCRGIQLAVNYFKSRGHTNITVFVPEWRKEASTPESPITDQHILHSLEQEGYLKYTPSRRLEDRRLIVCYDDKFIVRLAIEEQGVIVSNDQYRDLIKENPTWKDFIEKRLLQFTFAGDHFMPPDDPRGRNGPSIDQLLCKDAYSGSPSSRPSRKQSKTVIPRQPGRPEVCPHLHRCTFGKKCKYYHPPADTEGSTGSTTHTPSTSRSPTPSPSPDKHYMIHHRSREDLERTYNSRPDLSSDISISELGEHMAGLNVAGKQEPPQSISLQPRLEHQLPGQVVRSTPTLPTPQDPSFIVQPIHERRTHPMMNVPHGNYLDRPRRATEDFSHQLGHPSFRTVSPNHRPHTEHLYDTKHLQHQMPGFPGPRATLMRSDPNYQSQGGLISRDGNDYTRPVYSEQNDHYQARISNTSPHHPVHTQSYTAPPPTFRHHTQAESSHQHGQSFNLAVYQQALAVMPGCQDRIQRVFENYPGINSLESVIALARTMN